MEGFEVVTSDDSKLGHVIEVRDQHLIVEHGLLKKTKHAVPETFAHTSDDEQIVRLSVSKEIVESSPKLENGSIDTQAVAEHFGLAEGTPAPETEGYGEFLPDDVERFREALPIDRTDLDLVHDLLARGGIAALVGRSDPPPAGSGR